MHPFSAKAVGPKVDFIRQALQANSSSSVSYTWPLEHIVWPQSADLGLWSTGNGWGEWLEMTPILRTVMKASRYTAHPSIGAIGSPIDGRFLLRNYLNDTPAIA
ncbi:hypothetical protein BT96DRAFT_994170 [Gymnopus androsaceus JB14]|uniref:Uncharacterized protein n=1 Tax=Gymnopus androsaceus JB14 TaxID=1447944 RepID=A0A6A4HK30_9AGAR|nr:hypothetical protein BT96DRAFT_994170 [Gymnopus androsaceus JB14]